MQVPYLNFAELNKPYFDEIQSSIQNVLESGWYILGNHVEKFESDFASYCNVKECIAVANGLDALTLIFKSYILSGRLVEGDSVLVPANTYIASILAILNAGLEPVLVEPDEGTFNLNVNGIQSAVDSNVKAVLWVHLYGSITDAEKIVQFCKENRLLLIEDAAQAHGATAEVNGVLRKAGALGNAAGFSFYPGKNLGCLGDGGAITTNDSDIANILNMLRNYGSEQKYKNQIKGVNSRLDEIQAAVLSVKLQYLDRDNKVRGEFASFYNDNIVNNKVTLPQYHAGAVYHIYPVLVEDRSSFQDYLEKKQVSTVVHYPIPPHKQRALSELQSLQLPITEYIHKHIVSLPLNPAMTKAQAEYVAQLVNDYL